MSILLTSKQRNKIKRAVKALNDVRRELEQENPENVISWYHESGNLNLIDGETHKPNGDANQDSVIDLFTLDRSDGGGW